MNNKQKNRKNKTSQVYSLLPEYQYVTGMPQFNMGGQAYDYDHFMTNQLFMADTGTETETKKEKKKRIKNYDHPYLKEYINLFGEDGNMTNEYLIKDIMSSMNVTPSDTLMIDSSMDQSILNKKIDFNTDKYISDVLGQSRITHQDRIPFYSSPPDDDGNSYSFMDKLYYNDDGDYTQIRKVTQQEYGGEKIFKAQNGTETNSNSCPPGQEWNEELGACTLIEVEVEGNQEGDNTNVDITDGKGPVNQNVMLPPWLQNQYQIGANPYGTYNYGDPYQDEHTEAVNSIMNNSLLGAAFMTADSLKGAGNRIKKAFMNINPNTNLPYKHTDFGVSTLTNTTDENVVLDPEGLAKLYDEKGRLKEEFNTADNLFMTQNEAKAGYFNQAADYFTKTFIDENEFLEDGVTPNPNYGKPLLSKQTMDKDGNITYADIEYNEDVQVDNPTYNPDLPISEDNQPFTTETVTKTRAHTDADLTVGDKVQEHVKDLNVSRIQYNDDYSEVDSFTMNNISTNEDGSTKTIEQTVEYDPDADYSEGEYINLINRQDVLNQQKYGYELPQARRGLSELRRFVYAQDGAETNAYFQNGGGTPQPSGRTYKIEGRIVTKEEYDNYVANGGTNATTDDDNIQAPIIPEATPQPSFIGPQPFNLLDYQNTSTTNNDADSDFTPDTIDIDAGTGTGEPVEGVTPYTPPGPEAPVEFAYTDKPELTEEQMEMMTEDQIEKYNKMRGKEEWWNKKKAQYNTSLLGKTEKAFTGVVNEGIKAVDFLNKVGTEGQVAVDEAIAANENDEFGDFATALEASRSDKGDFDLVSGVYRANTLGYGDGPRGNITQMGGEMGNRPEPNYAYLKEFLNAAIVSYEPSFLMAQARDGEEIEADMNLIKELMAAGADFEII